MPEPSQDLNKTNVELINFRLDQLQLSAQAVNAQLASLATQIGGIQSAMTEKFMTRVEFAEVLRQKELQQSTIDRRLDAIDVRNDDQDRALYDIQKGDAARGWMIAGAMLSAVISVIVGAVGWIRPH